MNNQPNNPLHGITLEQVVTKLVEHYGWDGLGRKISINCFKSDPSIKSSLKFLRRTGWARANGVWASKGVDSAHNRLRMPPSPFPKVWDVGG